MTATRPQSTEGTGESLTASAGRYSQATMNTSSSQRLNATSLITILSSWGRWGQGW
ncbi:MAG TPA: hypothetical protein VMF57_20505 [Solirubrobacteraceae bacterium]|nr:hypothetical protein [Solirubrobacteraceae bacterium]